MTDEAQIRALLGAMTEAWNAGDATAYAEQFTVDADYITWFGAHSSGRASIADMHRFLFAGPLKGSRLEEGSGSTVRFLTPDVALVISHGGNSTADAGSTLCLTAVRERDRWRFASFQNTHKTDIAGAAHRAPGRE